MAETIHLLYGRDGLDLDLSGFSFKATVLSNRRLKKAELSREDLFESFENPTGSAPLKKLIHPDDSLCIVTSDGTRPYIPMRFMLHAILDHLGFVPAKTTVITGSGSHVPHTEKELDDLFCQSLRSRLKIISHDSRSKDNIEVGRLADGGPVTMNRHYLEADRKIVLGHIEPHLFAGYTGGPKGIVPAICGIETIHRLHSFEAIADLSSTYGDIEDNATTSLIREMAAMAPPDFLVNLILDEKQKPVDVFSGHYIEAHRAGVATARASAEVLVDRKYPVVLTTNSGHPLDQNLYQTVKGIEAALTLVKPGGTIIIASECGKGVPSGSRFEEILTSAKTPETLLERISNEYRATDDRWQAQRLCRLLQDYRVILVSSLGQVMTEKCLLDYAPSVDEALKKVMDEFPGLNDIAVLPDGPLTIPVFSG